MGIKSLNPDQPFYNIFSETSGGSPEVPGPPGGFEATGGTKTTPGDGYIYHIFTSSGALAISGPAKAIEFVVVGGGGGGGWDRGGGGRGGAGNSP